MRAPGGAGPGAGRSADSREDRGPCLSDPSWVPAAAVCGSLNGTGGGRKPLEVKGLPAALAGVAPPRPP